MVLRRLWFRAAQCAPAPVPSVMAPPPPLVVAAPAKPAPIAPKVEEFGSETVRKPEPPPDAPKEIQEIKAIVTQVEFSRTNRFIVTLDNGQVWRQIEGDVAKAHFHKSGDAVTVAHGVFGSYVLTLDGHDLGLFRVRRVR